jgi:DNA-binding NtrC family response regulator
MKLGALDYLLKPIDVPRFTASVARALELHALRREVASLRSSFLAGPQQTDGAFAAIRTRTPRMLSIFSYLEGIAGTEQPVLITGETGVGKELVARAIHDLSGRSGQFVAVNLAGLDEQMLSDTLFGHRRAAFTGADSEREGMVARAARGTLFLDEIGDLSPQCQVKLLRFLQDGEYYPLGADRPLRSAARIVAATNRDLYAMMAAGSFRRDLYYRLCVHEVPLPPLRERRVDIPLLFEAFLCEAAESLGRPLPAYAPAVIDHLAGYRFPGNIRELRAMVYKAVALHRGGVMGVQLFRDLLDRDIPPSSPGKGWFNPDGEFPTLKNAVDLLVEESLCRSGGNQGAAAALLGITRQALNKRLTKRQED